MKEQRYYEFQAIDRPLTEREMGALRAASARARISPRSFVDRGDRPDLRDEDVWMERYFDASLSWTSFGVRALQVRLPAVRLGLGAARRYCPGESATVRKKDANVFVRLVSEEDGDDAEPPQLAPVIGVRDELASGDLRALYLGWLGCVQAGELEDDVREPPVPPGLGELSPALTALAELLRIEGPLIAVAAAASPTLAAGLRDDEVAAWVRRLPLKDKDTLLARLMIADHGPVRSELLRRYREVHPAPPVSAARTVGELLAGADQRARIAR